MKQFVVVLLAAFTLSSPAFAGTIDYDTGKFVSGTFTGFFSNKINIDIIGRDNEIDISIGKLVEMSSCVSGSTCFMFTGGTVSVDGGGVFRGTINGGFTIKNIGEGGILGTLVSVPGGSPGLVFADFFFSGNKITSGSGDVVSATPVPEPTAFSLLGMGLVSFLGFLRMKTSL